MFSFLFLDLWCSPIVSCNGKLYLLSVIRDFSHFTWLLNLKIKDQILSIFKSFMIMIQIQFKCSIMSIQRDLGSEFVMFKS